MTPSEKRTAILDFINSVLHIGDENRTYKEILNKLRELSLEHFNPEKLN